jgi:MFS family permease
MYLPNPSHKKSEKEIFKLITDNKKQVILFSALGSLFSGYSLAVIVATVGQPTWYSSLHLSPSPSIPGYSHTTTIIGAVNGVFFAAGFLGTFLAGWLSDNLGRVKCLRIAALIGILGGAIQTGSRNQAMVSKIAVCVGGKTDGIKVYCCQDYYGLEYGTGDGYTTNILL